MTHEEVTTPQHTRRSEQNINLELTLKIKETTATHEEIQHKKKITNKQVDRIETTLGQTKLLEEISSKKETEEDF